MTHFKAISLLLFLTSAFHTANGQQTKTKSSQTGFAVLELFTSEGCSSCPPADQLMGKLQQEFGNKKVYILAYHVDYWDRLGWKDTYSSPNNSQRQNEYSKWLPKHSIYTPQLIINGKTTYIGSQEKNIRDGIAMALSKPATAELSITARQISNRAEVNYKVSGNSKNTALLLAVVQPTGKSHVTKGENKGKSLSHYQIVRIFSSQNLMMDQSGITNIHFSKSFMAGKVQIVGLVQDRATGEIVGASKTDFNIK